MANPPSVKPGPKSSKAYRDEANADADAEFAKLDPLNRIYFEKHLVDRFKVSAQNAKTLASLVYAKGRVSATPGGRTRDPKSCRSRVRALMENTGVSSMKEFHALRRGGNMEAQSIWWDFHDDPKSKHYRSRLISRNFYELNKKSHVIAPSVATGT